MLFPNALGAENIEREKDAFLCVLYLDALNRRGTRRACIAAPGAVQKMPI
jgi:hypothetical protein